MDSPRQYFTFDDMLLKPAYSDVLPNKVDVKTKFTRNIDLAIPLVSSAMDTVTESEMAIAMAQNGGIGCIHKNFTILKQQEEVRKVKKYESGMVIDPITISPDTTIDKALKLMKEERISGIPVVESGNKLVGILTNRDVRFVIDKSKLVADLMTKDNLVTVRESVSDKEAKELLHSNKIEKLIVVDKNYCCKGLITVKDIEKSKKYPNAVKDNLGRLRVAAATGIGKDGFERAEALIEADVDAIVIDTAHGHSEGVINAVKNIRAKYPDIEIIAGNIATSQAAADLIKAGVDAVKVGIGPGSICTTRIIAGVGVPQLTAIIDVAKVCKDAAVPLIADGGIRFSGDVAKAIAAGADSIMIGGLFAGTDEAPGEKILFQGRSYKVYRGMGSLGAMTKGSADRYSQGKVSDQSKFVPEGVEGRVPFKGELSDVIYQLIGGLRSAMGYCGNKDILNMQENCEFITITSASMRESLPHDIIITKAAPNYDGGVN
jgi:IMP dehydrogenase